MTDIRPIFSRLGLQQYIPRFIDEGFDTWETVLYITESDFDALQVKLGHRRKLQLEIAIARGLSIEQIITPAGRGQSDDFLQGDSDAKSSASHGDGRQAAGGTSKRKYRRHPKPDENAPERPPSAYVIFSNQIREELRPQKLSFTEIAKTVGERWQVLPQKDKERFESQAATAKEAYSADMAAYKKTPQYRDYMQYLTEFKAKYSVPTASSGTAQSSRTRHELPLASIAADGKRPRLESEPSNTSSGSGGTLPSIPTLSQEHSRQDSFGTHAHSPASLHSPESLQAVTPVSAHRTHQPSGGQTSAAPVRYGDMSRGSNVQRIVPLEGREPAPGPIKLGPALAEANAHPSSHPRRSSKSPASFLRQETTYSSVSSVFSTSGSDAPGRTSPVTPIEEPRGPRTLPPIVPPANVHETGSSVGAALPPLAVAHPLKMSLGRAPDYRYPAPPPGRPQDSALTDPRKPRPHSTATDLAMEDAPWPASAPETDHSSSEQRSHARGEGVPRHASTSALRQERVDPLSVLALAGRYVDRDGERPDEQRRR